MQDCRGRYASEGTFRKYLSEAEDDDAHETAAPRGTEARAAGDDAGEGPLGEIHELAANLLYALILLHLAGVLFESRRSGGKLVAAMLPGHH